MDNFLGVNVVQSGEKLSRNVADFCNVEVSIVLGGTLSDPFPQIAVTQLHFNADERLLFLLWDGQGGWVFPVRCCWIRCQIWVDKERLISVFRGAGDPRFVVADHVGVLEYPQDLYFSKYFLNWINVSCNLYEFPDRNSFQGVEEPIGRSLGFIDHPEWSTAYLSKVFYVLLSLG